MLAIQIIFPITVIFSFTLQIKAHVQSTSRQFSFNNTYDVKLIVNEKAIDKSKFSFSRCDRPNNTLNERCSIYLIDTIKSEHEISCNITLKAGNEGGIIMDNPLSIPFGKDKVILVYEEFFSLGDGNNLIIKLATLDMTGCKILSEAKVRANVYDFYFSSIDKRYFVLIYDDSYAVRFGNERLCGDKSHCRVIIDKEGKINGPTGWFKVGGLFLDIVPVTSGFPSKGHVVIIDHVDRIKVFLLDANNELKPLNTIELESNRIGYSVAHDTVGVCLKVNSTFDCTFIDLEGKIKLHANFSESAIYAHPYGLSNGKFLVFTFGCSEADPKCENGVNYYRVKKFDADGKEIGHLNLNVEKFSCGFTDTKMLRYQFYENDDGKYCMSLVCFEHFVYSKSKFKEHHVDAVTSCFAEQDIKV